MAKETAFIVVRELKNEANCIPIAIFEVLEDADNLAAQYNQELRDIGFEGVTFSVITTPFYPE